MFTAKDEKTARKLASDVIDEYEAKAPKAMETLGHALTVLQLPERYHKRLRTTNLPERVNE